MSHILRCHDIVKTDFIRADNCCLYDLAGRRYIDFESGIWCTALGHNHPRIVQTLQKQAKQLIHVGTRYPSYLAEEAATAALRITEQHDGKCVFLSSGSEAVEFAVQAARRISGKPLLLTLAGSYLAAYGSAGRQSSEEWYIHDWAACDGCSPTDECDLECWRLNDIPFEHIGGFVFEPGNAAGLVKFPPRHLIQTLVSMLRQQGGLVVANEITTGMGRTGRWFGHQHYGIQPDIVAIGKGLGNGYPVSAVAMTGEVADQLEQSAFRYAQSHQNDPLGCAIAKEVIAVFEEESLVERSQRVGAHLLGELKLLAEQCRAIKEVRGRGLMIALELAGTGEHPAATTVYRELLERGFLVGYNPAANVLRFYPALTIEQEHIALLVDHLGQILEG